MSPETESNDNENTGVPGNEESTTSHETLDPVTNKDDSETKETSEDVPVPMESTNDEHKETEPPNLGTEEDNDSTPEDTNSSTHDDESILSEIDDDEDEIVDDGEIEIEDEEVYHPTSLTPSVQ